MEIEIGEFVRTKTDGICKLLYKQIDGNGKFCGNVDKPFFLREDNITKHSKNIIDLIQEGDYVNGYYCKYITDINTGEKHLCNYDLNVMQWIPLKDIDVWDNILTKEQYMNNCYVVKE